MNRNQFPTWVVAAAVVAVALAVVGVPLGALLPFAVLLACPLMMVFMMRGMHGGEGGCHGGHENHSSHEDHTGHGCEHDPTRHRESQS